jgi:hypothetical protein
MSTITLRDLIINARQESVQMRNFFIGVEHLFIALLQIQGGLAGSIVQEQGLTPDYVTEAIRRKTGKGTSQRTWVGIPMTPRAELVLDIAKEFALEEEREEPNERDLLKAILSEGDSLPVRVLNALGVNLDRFADTAKTYLPTTEAHPPDIAVIFGADFDRNYIIEREHLFILRRMFASYSRIRIERRLTGFRKALILMVTPIQDDEREEAPVVVKIDQVDNILDEVQRYETHVKSTLPLQAARLEDQPTAPEASDLAGIKYTLVASTGNDAQDLRDRVRTQGTDGLGQLLRRELYARFCKNWWLQNRQYRFQAWMEYDWLLPPLLTLDLAENIVPPSNALVLRIPFNRTRVRTRLRELQVGDVVVLENFTIQWVDRDENVIKLAVGYGNEADKRAYKVEVRGADISQSLFYRGEIVDRLVGKVWKTRHDALAEAVLDLQPDFDLRQKWIPITRGRVVNPLYVYDDLLDRHITGSQSKIHGDLHLGNVLIGPNNSMWLIDFGHTRDGHTLFDWATFEVSLLGDAVMLGMDDSWGTARRILHQLMAINSRTEIQPDVSVSSAIGVVSEIREIVRECLAVPDRWEEYYVALALCALRATTWKTMSLGGRRLMFLLAGLMALELSQPNPFDNLTPSPEEVDFNLAPSASTPKTDVFHTNMFSSDTPDYGISSPQMPETNEGKDKPEA